MKLETSDCWQNEENFKALLMVTKIFNLSLWKVEKMSNENCAIFMRRVVVSIHPFIVAKPENVKSGQNNHGGNRNRVI